MVSKRQIARDISYAGSAETRSGRTMIRMMENVTGRPGLIRRADGYEQDIAAGQDFWQVMVQRYGLSLRITGGSLDAIPQTGPLVLIANHPYGILDGLVLGHILSQCRGDFRILANRVFCKAADLNRVILPISFDPSKSAVQTNLETRRIALNYLGGGGAVGVFPGGTVSTASRWFARPMDPGWRTFTARMITRSGATVVPVFFEGHNSRLFQIASHLHSTLRLGLLIKEFRARVDEPVRLVIGTPVDAGDLRKHAGDPPAMMDFLRQTTYALSPKPLASMSYGFEFDETYRT